MRSPVKYRMLGVVCALSMVMLQGCWPSGGENGASSSQSAPEPSPSPSETTGARTNVPASAYLTEAKILWQGPGNFTDDSTTLAGVPEGLLISNAGGDEAGLSLHAWEDGSGKWRIPVDEGSGGFGFLLQKEYYEDTVPAGHIPVTVPLTRNRVEQQIRDAKDGALLGRAVLGRHGAVLEAGSGALYVAGSDDSGAYGLSRFESLAASSPQWTGALNAGQLATNSRVLEREGRAEFCEFNRLGQEGLCTVSVSLSDGSPADWLPAGSRFLRIGEKKLVIDEGGSYTLLDGAGKKLWFRESGKVEWAHHVADSVILGGKDLVWRVDLDSGDPQWQETWGEGSELAEIDGKVIVVRTHEMLQTAVLDVTTGRPSFTSHGETPAPAAIMLTADGRLVVAGQGTGESGLYAAAIKPGTEQYLWQAWYSGYEEVMALSGHLVLRSQTGFAALG